MFEHRARLDPRMTLSFGSTIDHDVAGDCQFLPWVAELIVICTAPGPSPKIAGCRVRTCQLVFVGSDRLRSNFGAGVRQVGEARAFEVASG
jgi:hypothetical protein